MDYQSVLEKIQYDIEPFLRQGHAAEYIPALAEIPLLESTAEHPF